MKYAIRAVATFIAAFFMVIVANIQTPFWLTILVLFVAMTTIQVLMDGVAWLCDNRYIP